MASYPGGKNGQGVYQRIISLIPPHDVYVEPFVGGEQVDTIVARRRIWRSKCGRYRVTESRIPHLSIRYYAQVLYGRCWSNLSEHRKRRPAEAACARHARAATRR